MYRAEKARLPVAAHSARTISLNPANRQPGRVFWKDDNGTDHNKSSYGE